MKYKKELEISFQNHQIVFFIIHSELEKISNIKKDFFKAQC